MLRLFETWRQAALRRFWPGKAARHVKKTECFCFNQQPFKAREKKIMPVRLMLDPDLPRDLTTVTLSYTFFDVTELAQDAEKPQG